MKYLSQAKSGIIKKPLFLLVYGPSGVGKTTLACSAPKPILLELEQGANNINVTRLPKPETFQQISEMIDELLKEKHNFETFIIDSVDWAENILWADVCRENKIKSIDELGYGRGYSIALKHWVDLVEKLTKLREKMNVILVGHSKIRTFNDPTQVTAYDRYEIKLHEKAGALLKEACDVVGFANFETIVKKEGSKGKAFSDGTRFMYLERSSGFDAKNRFGLPAQIPLEWEALIYAIEKSTEVKSPSEIKESIKSLLTNIKDEKVLEYTKEKLENKDTPVEMLNKIQNKLRTMTMAM